MAAVSNSVVHLTMRFGRTVLSIGTGFIYQYGDDFFIVTAWHNLTGLHSETLKHLNTNLAVPDNIVVTLAISIPNFVVTRHSIVLSLMDDCKSLFYVHNENWPRVDVAIIPFDPSADYKSEIHLSTGEEGEILFSPIMKVYGGGASEVCPVQKYIVPNGGVIKEWLDSVEATEELFIPGYPKNIHDYYSQPVWKRATIASSVQLGWNREPKFLIDSASTSGMSGSPVLYYSPNGYVQIRGKKYQFDREVAILAGIYVGRLGAEDGNDPQVGTVWNQSVIEEIIQGRCFEKLPHEIQLSDGELLECMQDLLKKCSPKGLESIKNSDSPSRHYFCHQLLRKINGRASPDRALKAVVEAAQKYDGPLVNDD